MSATKSCNSSCGSDQFAYNGYCYYNCPAQTFAQGNVCVACSGSCQTCNGPNENNCVSCKYPNYNKNGTCVFYCQAGQVYNEATNTCSNQCPAGTITYENQCLSGCPEGFYVSNGTCAHCDDTCGTCAGPNANDCTSCQTTSGTSLSMGKCVSGCPAGQATFNYQCVANCPESYFANANHVCQACDASCKSCYGSSANQCSACRGNSNLMGSTCQQFCNSTTVYDPETQQCLTACPSQKATYQGQCLNSCPSSTYRTQQGTCAQCFYQDSQPDYCLAACPVKTFTRANNTCGSCDSSCSSCSGSAPTKCSTCPSNYYLTVQGRCVPKCASGFHYELATDSCQPGATTDGEQAAQQGNNATNATTGKDNQTSTNQTSTNSSSSNNKTNSTSSNNNSNNKTNSTSSNNNNNNNNNNSTKTNTTTSNSNSTKTNNTSSNNATQGQDNVNQVSQNQGITSVNFGSLIGENLLMIVITIVAIMVAIF